MCTWGRLRQTLSAKRHNVQNGMGGPQRRHHQLWQLRLCHVDGVPVYNHGGLDGSALLGESVSRTGTSVTSAGASQCLSKDKCSKAPTHVRRTGSMCCAQREFVCQLPCQAESMSAIHSAAELVCRILMFESGAQYNRELETHATSYMNTNYYPSNDIMQ